MVEIGFGYQVNIKIFIKILKGTLLLNIQSIFFNHISSIIFDEFFKYFCLCIPTTLKKTWIKKLNDLWQRDEKKKIKNNYSIN